MRFPMRATWRESFELLADTLLLHKRSPPTDVDPTNMQWIQAGVVRYFLLCVLCEDWGRVRLLGEGEERGEVRLYTLKQGG